MKTTMNLVKYCLMALAITAFTASCQKDNLEEAVLPETTQAEQSNSDTGDQNGTNGTQGEKGPKGDKGDQGEPGVAGPEGPEGPQGPAGQDGEAIGVPGPKGDTGATGATGPAGEAGPTGPKGDTGDTGPAGANGTDGTNGVDGVDGTNGIDGTNGVDGVDGASNIMYSDWLDQDLTEQNFPKFKQMSVPVPEITDEFLNNGGVVLGFFRFTSATHNLPYTHVSQKTIRYMIYSPTSGGRVLFTLQSTDDTALDNKDIEGINPAFNPQYKFVLIPGGISLSGKSQKDFKKMSYEEVMDHFGLSY